MATKAEKVLKTQTFKSRGMNPLSTATKYVNSGLAGLGLKPAEKLAMKQKLIPIVENRIKNDRKRTVSRVKNVVSRETKARLANAQNNI